jgi:hypothetical protein
MFYHKALRFKKVTCSIEFHSWWFFVGINIYKPHNVFRLDIGLSFLSIRFKYNPLVFKFDLKK